MFATVTVNYIHSELPQNGKCCVYMHAPTRSGKILLLFASFCPQSAYQSSSLLRCICAYINLTSTTFTFSNVCFVLFVVLEGNYPNAPYDVHVTCDNFEMYKKHIWVLQVGWLFLLWNFSVFQKHPIRFIYCGYV